MRVPTPSRRRDPFDQGTSTPMIDVVFLLLIFFVCAASGQIRELVLPAEMSRGTVNQVNTPVADPVLRDQVWIHLANGPAGLLVELNDQQLPSAADLRTRLLALGGIASELPVILDLDPDVAMQDVIDVYDTCFAAGFESISFAAQAESAQGAAAAP